MSIRVNVDLANPGQFFACCGLLELADRISPGVEAWFEKPDSFHIQAQPERQTDPELSVVLKALRSCSVSNTISAEQLKRREDFAKLTKKQIDADSSLKAEKAKLDALWRESPVLFGEPFNLRVDWFLDEYAGGDIFKTWAGQQSVIDIARGVQSCMPDTNQVEADHSQILLSRCISAGLPFNFDADLGGVGDDRDIGFSFDPLRGISDAAKMQIRPTTELLAFIGLQRFRPLKVDKENRFLYWTWYSSLPINSAAAAACGMCELPNSAPYEFPLLYRTKYLKSFLPSTPIARRKM